MRRFPTQLLFLAPGFLASSLLAQVAITGAKIDGQQIEIRSGAEQDAAGRSMLRIPPGAKDIEFSIAGGALKTGKPCRLRFKLEGYDQNWQNLYSAMRLVVRMLDASNVIIAATESKIDQTSGGWRGTVQSSQFTPGRLETVAPDRASRVQVWCVSGGPEYTTGVFAFRNVRLRIGAPGTEDYHEVAFSTEAGNELNEPLGSPSDWRRDGSRPQMAQVLRLNQPEGQHALALVDSDPLGFAAWLNPIEKCPPVRPGQSVVVEWEDCHWVGQVGPSPITYSRLKPGNYWLRVGALGMDNVEVAQEASLYFTVLPPIYHRLSFWLVVGGAGTIGAFLIARQLTRSRMQRQVDRLERQHLLERERTRIARDIHDDLGTSLTQISLLSESARKHAVGSPETLAELDRICASSREAVEAMDEIVWAADPGNDSLDELATYISGFAQDLLNAVGVRCRLEMPMRLPEWGLSAEVRHNVFLAFKEALNNALKHGKPTEVRIALVVEDAGFEISIEDNGCGFEPGRNAGHGLQNMRSRVEKAGGRFSIEVPPGGGTRVRLFVPVGIKA